VTEITAPGSVSKWMPWSSVVVVALASSVVSFGVVTYPPGRLDASTLRMVPDFAATRTSHAHSCPEASVSHVHQTYQSPPEAYSTKTPTPSPGAALIVCPVSTSTRRGVDEAGGGGTTLDGGAGSGAGSAYEEGGAS